MANIKKNSILTLNIGSSSIKLQLFSRDNLERILKGKVYNFYEQPLFEYEVFANPVSTHKQQLAKGFTHENGLSLVLNWLFQENQAWQISVVVHRIVHGGLDFNTHVIIDDRVLEGLKALRALAPLHQHYQVLAIEAVRRISKDLIQIACFDTVFHFSRSEIYTQYALPKVIRDRGVYKYGFHGLSYEWIVYYLRQKHPTLASGRLVVAHLGSGSSLCAIQNGKSVDTTMGFTPLDGLVMGSRSGSIDPSIVIYMIRELGYSNDEVEYILNNQSGLLGLSEISSDVRQLEESEDPKAKFALKYFCNRISQMIGMMIVTMGGVDGIIFTGGIGEHSVLVRKMVLGSLTFFPPFETHVVSTNEEWMMAKHSAAILV